MKIAREDGTSSLRKAIGVLKCFSEERRELSMTDVAHALALPPATAARILGALVEEGLLERDERSKRYQLGIQCLRMGKIANLSGTLRVCARPFMEKLRDRFDETVNLYVREGRVRICYAQCETTSTLRRSIPLGSRFPLAAGAAGRCLLAWMPPEFIREVMEDLSPFTENTVTERARFLELLEETKRNLFTISRAERERGVLAIASPVFDAPGSVRASLSIAGPASRFTDAIIEEMIVMLKQVAVEFSELLSSGKKAEGER
ncbi:MAG: IclR family transcriptional regulator [Synergistaceae bacterium]|jgi:DNA-binding IclR family transcriptional regulator|nr:IclR family transcriptional regulator [Synergistaceae bacterium]